MSILTHFENALHDTCNDHSEQTQHYATNIVPTFSHTFSKIRKGEQSLSTEIFLRPAFFFDWNIKVGREGISNRGSIHSL